MKWIEGIGKRLCAFSCDYALKARHVSPGNDFKIWVKHYDYTRLSNRCVCRITRPQGCLTAVADNQAFLFTASLSSWPGLRVWLKQSPSASVPGLNIRQTVEMWSHLRGSADIEFSMENVLPKVDAQLLFSRGLWTVGYFPTLTLASDRYGVTGLGWVSVGLPIFRTQAVIEVRKDGTSQGWKLTSRWIDVGVVRNDSTFALFCEGRIGRRCALGFQSRELFQNANKFERALATAAFGARYSKGNGSFAIRWQAPKSLAWKAKYLFSHAYELAVMARAQNLDFAKSLFSFSLCVHSDDREQGQHRRKRRQPEELSDFVKETTAVLA
jgi:hypothetical protein